MPDNMNEDIESLCRALVWNVLGPQSGFYFSADPCD